MEQQKMERGLKPRHVEMIALGGDDWCRLVHGVGQHHSDGGTVGIALLCRNGRRHVFHHAHHGGNALSGTGYGLLCHVWA